MRTIVVAAAALIGLAAPALAQNFNIPAGDEGFSQPAAVRADQPRSGFVALAPEMAAGRHVAKAHRAAHHARWLAD